MKSMLSTLPRIALVAFALSLNRSPAYADPIDPGFDLFHTPAGGALLGPSELAAFGLPPVGPISMRGKPIGPSNTDTIVERTTGLPPAGTGIIQAELVALSLVSVSPINVMGSFFDVFVTLNPTIPSFGQLTVATHNDALGGGTFDSFFNIFAQVEIVEIGNPLHSQTFTSPNPIRIESSGSTWSHTPNRPDYPNYPSGGFYPGVIQHSGPHPKIVPIPDLSSPAILLGCGLLTLLGYGFRLGCGKCAG